MDEDSDLPSLTPAPKTGFVGGNETNFYFTDDDVFHSEVEVAVTSSGW